MKARKAKLIMLAVLAVFMFFFSSDFGLIDVEKTSIITAVAIDKEQSKYVVTAQIAVPEATDTNSENLKAHISGCGSTIGGAIKDLGDLSGWFPKLAFCNLIILSNDLASENVVDVLDYFAKSLRVQDSALVILSEKKASELLELATPLDNISSFALQKILFKNTGFDRDVYPTDIKTFCAGHYSDSHSALMPIVKVLPAGESNEGGSKSSGGESGSGADSQSQGGSSESSKESKSTDNLFNAKTTALFKDGVKVGELDEPLTLSLNSLFQSMRGTTFSVDGIKYNGKDTNYLLTIIKSRPKITLKATENKLILDIDLKLYCKTADHNSDYSNAALSLNEPIPDQVKEKAEQTFKANIEELILTEKQTACDFLKIKQKLYRYNHKQYSRYKDNFLSVMDSFVNVTILGQE